VTDPARSDDVKQHTATQTNWYATRTIPMPGADETGIESILIWVEHRNSGEGTWAVGRASDLAQRDFPEPRTSDYVFEGYEIDDALQAANEALEDDLAASEADGIEHTVRPFTRKELQEPLSEWFWGRRPS
jgi:hypothetical protein